MINNGVIVYLDDILVFSKTKEEHLCHLRRVLQKLRDNKLYAQMPKCEFMATRIEHLGHVIDQHGIQVDPTNVTAVQQWPKPESVKDLQSFLGLANYYRKFIRNFATIAAPLTDLLKQMQAWSWGDVQQHAFERLKVALTKLQFYSIQTIVAAS